MATNHEWTILPAASFSTAQPREPGGLGVEVLAQVRPTGRFMDNMRLVLGGSQLLEVRFSSRHIYASEMIPETTKVLQRRPEDITIRQNLTTSEWKEVNDLLRARELVASGPDPDEDDYDNKDILQLIHGLAEPAQGQASLRWAVGATIDNKLELVLQALPAAASVLNSKPIFKG
jgi:hypothetical protein